VLTACAFCNRQLLKVVPYLVLLHSYYFILLNIVVTFVTRSSFCNRKLFMVVNSIGTRLLYYGNHCSMVVYLQ